MFREAGIECRASHSGGGSGSSTGRGSRGRTFTGPTAAASAATTAVAAALSLSLSRSLSSASPRNSLFSRTRDRVGIYIKIFAFSSEEKLPSPLAYYSSSLLFFYLIPSRLPVVCSRATWLILPVAYACLKD